VEMIQEIAVFLTIVVGTALIDKKINARGDNHNNRENRKRGTMRLI
jgi:hypothetical protein